MKFATEPAPFVYSAKKRPDGSAVFWVLWKQRKELKKWGRNRAHSWTHNQQRMQ